MTHRESVGIVARVAKRVKVPIIVGVSAPGFAPMRELTQDAMEAGAAGRHDRAAQHASHRRLDRRVLPAGLRGDRRRRPVRDPGLPAHVLRADDARGHPPHRAGQCVLRDAEARGLAGPREDLAAARVGAGRRDAPSRRSSSATTRCSSTSRWSAARTARIRATASPTCWSTSCGCRRKASATRPTISSTRTCRSSATSSSRARARRAQVRAHASRDHRVGRDARPARAVDERGA